ncbi:MAG: PIN domain-containing protein [Leptospiraceae bacterium]|nr:PIN domain-containing protein [Leptospiraceae bacterium]
MLEQENEDNPFEDRKENIQEWLNIAAIDISETEDILEKAEKFFIMGLKNNDAIHIACAEYSKSDYFITTDSGILKKADHVTGIKIINPIQFLELEENIL